MPCVTLTPLAPWQPAQLVSARRLPSAMSVGVTLSVRNSSPGRIVASWAAAPRQPLAIAAPAMAAITTRFFEFACIVFCAFMNPAKTVTAFPLQPTTGQTPACCPVTHGKSELRLFFRRLACVIGRNAFDDRIAVGQAHIVHHGIPAPVVAIGPQRQYQIVLILPIDDWDRQRRIVQASGMATIALVSRQIGR